MGQVTANVLVAKKPQELIIVQIMLYVQRVTEKVLSGSDPK